jgi:membrane-bound lytic murein transglycosylase MltF
MTCRRKYFSLFVVPLLTTVFVLLWNQPVLPILETQTMYPNDTLRCAIGDQLGDYFIYRAEPVGYQMEMIRYFAERNRCKYRIHVVASPDERRERLMSERDDMVVYSRAEYGYHEQDDALTAAFLLPDSSAWVVRSEDREMVVLLSRWMAQFQTTNKYKRHQERYFQSPLTIHAQSLYASLSPYDDIIRRQAKKIDWDWRLLAALICQESRFRPDALSARGAYGLMQMMPATAEHFSIECIEDPEENIAAGIKLLQYLKQYSRLDEADDINRRKFILAAYNAGLGRINDCRAFAESQNKNPNDWEEVASVIPLMRHEIHYNGENIQLGRFKGAETLNYVREVWERYENYRNLVAE